MFYKTLCSVLKKTLILESIVLSYNSLIFTWILLEDENLFSQNLPSLSLFFWAHIYLYVLNLLTECVSKIDFFSFLFEDKYLKLQCYTFYII